LIATLLQKKKGPFQKKQILYKNKSVTAIARIGR